MTDKKEEIEYETPDRTRITLIIPEACANGDENCPHTKKKKVIDYNPV